jgi:ketosteroid isomerase-like protein
MAPDEVRQTFLGAVSRGDVDTIVGLYHSDAVLEAPEGRFEGPDQVAEYYRTQLTPMDAELHVVATYDTDDTGVTEWVMEATNTGDLQFPDGSTVPATGRKVRQRGCDIAIYSDGRIVTHRVYYDNVEAMSQLGLLPGSEG